MVLGLITSAASVQAGYLGKSLADYQQQYPATGTSLLGNKLFISDGLAISVTFYKDRAVYVQVQKLNGEPFSKAELQGILKSNTEGSPWLRENLLWVTAHASPNPDARAFTVRENAVLVFLNVKEVKERELSMKKSQ
jgi:hypothetical protein